MLFFSQEIRDHAHSSFVSLVLFAFLCELLNQNMIDWIIQKVDLIVQNKSLYVIQCKFLVKIQRLH